MKASLELFTKELVNLRHYIQTLDLERVLLGSAIDALRATETEALVLELQDHVELGADKRRFDYNSIIVSLYGFLEQFIESLITEYVHYLNCVVPKYKELPEAITRVHTNLTFGLIKHANYTRFRGLVEEAMLISNLHSCLNDSEKYQVNSKAFSDHTANFRSDVVDSTFSRVGVNDVPRRVKEEPVFQNYLLSKYPGRNPANIKQEEAMYYLDDLAERRNEVAHGTPSDILANDILLDYVTFFEAYGPALFSVVRARAFPFEVKHRGIPLASPIGIFYNGHVVCINVKSVPIKVGDWLIAKTGDRDQPFKGSEIEELQVNNASCQEVDAKTSVDIGIRISFKAKTNQSFFLVPKEISLHPG